MLKRLVIVIALAVCGAVALSVSAKAHDSGQWEDTDPDIHKWFQELMQPDNPAVPCCGKSDAYWADEIEVVKGKVYAIITDTRPDEPLHRPHVPPGTKIEIPSHKMNKNSNPTGHNIVFMNPDGYVFCFITGTGV